MMGAGSGTAMEKPRIGMLLLASAWMRDVGLDAAGAGLGERVDRAARAIVAGLDIPTVPAILWPEVAPRPTRRQARAGLFFVEVRRAD